MSRRGCSGAVGVCLIAWSTMAAVGAPGADSGTGRDQVLDAIQAELKLVRQENEKMREEIDLLRVETQEDWLTEQRAEQIRGLVSDVLADVDTRTSLSGDGLMAGWSDNFFLSSADGRFLLRIGALVQNRFILNHRDSIDDVQQRQDNEDPWVYGFETTTARINLSGHLFGPDIQYRLSIGYGRDDPYHFTADDSVFGTRVYEAWVRQRITDEFGIKVGLFKIPFTRETLIYSGRQLAVDRSLIDYRLGLGRTMGIELDYIDDHFHGMLSYNSGSGALFTRLNANENVPPFAWNQNKMDYSFQGRLEFLIAGEWEQFKQFTSPPGQEFALMVGIAGGGMKHERTGIPNVSSPDLWSATGDISVMFGGASLYAAFIYQNENYLAPQVSAIDWYGMVAQGSFYINQKTEVYARYEWGGPVTVVQESDNFPTELVSIFMCGFNYYIDGQDVKWSVDGGISFNPISDIMVINQTGWRVEPEEHNAEFLIRTQLQLMF